MLALSVLLVEFDLGLQFRLKGCHGSLQRFTGWWGVPEALYVEFGVVFICGFCSGPCGPEMFKPDLLAESGHGCLEVGLGQGFFHTEFQTIPEQFFCARWGGLHSAEVMACSVVSSVQHEEL